MPPWIDEIEYYLLDGCEIMNECLFYHKASKTMIATDFLIFFTGDELAKKMGCFTKFCVGTCFGMWDKVKRGPEYDKGVNKIKMRKNISRVLKWDIR